VIQSRIDIRECTTIDEFEQCVQVQREVFALPERELSPVRHLVVTRNAGGHALGAWDNDRLAGFSLSVPAYINGRRAIYSHMTAICKEYQSLGLGARLKWEQRERALGDGIDYIRWTFEPLKAKNAYFNLEKLGATVSDYRVNFYGTDYGTTPEVAGKAFGIDSDRVMADWELRDPRVEALAAGETPLVSAIVPAAEVHVPADWLGLVASDLDGARNELLRVRGELQSAFERGLVARSFKRDGPSPAYLLF